MVVFPNCKYRINVDTANEIFIPNLSSFLPHSSIKKLYKFLILESYNHNISEAQSEKKQILVELANFVKKII